MNTNKIKKFKDDLKRFESEFVIIKKRKEDADKIMKIPGHWNMVPRQAGEFYLDSLDRCMAFLENVVDTFKEKEGEEEVEIIPAQVSNELPKRKDIKEKTEEIHKEDTEERCEEVKEKLIKITEKGTKKGKKYTKRIITGWMCNPKKKPKLRIYNEKNRDKIAEEVIENIENLKKSQNTNDLQQISENNSISGSIGDMGVEDA